MAAVRRFASVISGSSVAALAPIALVPGLAAVDAVVDASGRAAIDVDRAVPTPGADRSDAAVADSGKFASDRRSAATVEPVAAGFVVAVGQEHFAACSVKAGVATGLPVVDVVD